MTSLIIIIRRGSAFAKGPIRECKMSLKLNLKCIRLFTVIISTHLWDSQLGSTPVRIPLTPRGPNQGDLRSRCYTLMGFCFWWPRPAAPSSSRMYLLLCLLHRLLTAAYFKLAGFFRIPWKADRCFCITTKCITFYWYWEK